MLLHSACRPEPALPCAGQDLEQGHPTTEPTKEPIDDIRSGRAYARYSLFVWHPILLYSVMSSSHLLCNTTTNGKALALVAKPSFIMLYLGL